MKGELPFQWICVGLVSLSAMIGCTKTLDLSDECSVDLDCSSELICQENLCVQRESVPEDCRLIYGIDDTSKVFADNVIRIGMLQPRSGDLQHVGVPIEQAAGLAAREINQTGGISGKDIALIACNTHTSPEIAVKNARWLVDHARVSAVIGPATSASTIRVFNEVAKDAGTLLMTPSATAPAITDMVDDGLLWRTVPSDVIQAKALRYLVDEGGFRKVAVLNRDDAYGNGLASAFRVPFCEENGCGPDRYFSRSYSLSDRQEVMENDIILAVDDLVGFQPDAIVFIGFSAGMEQFVRAAAQRSELHTAIVFATDGAKDKALIERLSSSAEQRLLKNLIGSSPAAPSGELYQAFYQNYVGRYRNQTPQVYCAQAYDALYLLAYAFGGLSAAETVSGAQLRDVLNRLSSGPEIFRSVPTDFREGVAHLLTNPDAKFDFEGTSGPLDFNDKGEAPASIEAWHFDIEAQVIRSYGEVMSPDETYISGQIDRLGGRSAD